MSGTGSYYEAFERAGKSPFRKPFRIMFFIYIPVLLLAAIGELYTKSHSVDPMTAVSIHTLSFLGDLLLIGALYLLLRSYGKLVAIKWKVLYFVICVTNVTYTYINTLQGIE